MTLSPNAYREAIASIESGGNYQAIGPTDEKLGRALGKYQIMEANIGPWSREVLGRSVSSDEFLSSPELQDTIFDGKFGSYVRRFGEEGAAQAWFAGPGGVGKTNRKDVLGTNVGDYGKRFLSALSGDTPYRNVSAFGGGQGIQVSQSDLSAADVLKLFDTQETGAVDPVGGLNEQLDRQEQSAARLLELFDLNETVDPLQPRITEEFPMPRAGVESVPTDRSDKPFFDITAETVAPFTETLGAVGESLTGQGPSVVGEMLPESIPIYREGGAEINLPEGLRNVGGRIADVGLGLGAGLGALYSAGVGALADITEPVQGEQSARRMARDLSALPETFAGSPAALARAPAALARAPRMPRIPDAPEVPAEIPEATMRDTISRASSGNAIARQQLAEMSRVNPEAAAAAKRLGIEAPVDVFADNAMVQQAAGIVRAVRGSEAGSEWQETFETAQARAAELMRQEGATLDLATQSENVRQTLMTSIQELRDAAQPLYDDVQTKIPTGSKAVPTETARIFDEVITELGGDDTFKGPARSLYKAITSGEGMTYARLVQEKEQLGRAAFKNQGPYKDAATRLTTRLYAALSDDQQNFVGAVTDDTTAQRLQQANQLWADAKSIEDRLTAGFGKDAQGSIASTVTSAITSGSKGDIAKLNRVLDIVPDNLQKETLLTGIDALSQGRGAQGGFSFANYAKVYRGLRQNGKVYSKIAKAVGPETEGMMRDLYEVSLRMDKAAQNVPRTGMANQGLIAEGLLARVLDSSAGTAAKTGVGGVAGGMVGGPIGAGMGAAAAGSIKIGGRRAKAAGQLFKSPEFQRLAIEAASTTPSQASIQKAANSPAFKRWARTVGINDREQWLIGALTASQQTGQDNGSE